MDKVKLTFVVEVEGWSIAQLQRAVRAIDAMDSSNDDAILAEAVLASDVLQCYFTNQLGLVLNVVQNEMEDL